MIRLKCICCNTKFYYDGVYENVTCPNCECDKYSLDPDQDKEEEKDYSLNPYGVKHDQT